MICTPESGGARKLFLDRTYDFWGWTPLTHPPPKHPFRCPRPDKKGTSLLLFQISIYLHTHQDLKLKCCRVMGQNLRYGRPCTRDLPGIHNWLAQSHIAPISSEFYYLTGAILKIWSELLLHWRDSSRCLHPSACASDFWTRPQTPCFTQLAQKGCQLTGLELRIPMIYLRFRGNGLDK